MNETYDVIVCGTGLKECVLSGLLATKGKKVLHVDRNEYYGADTASLNLTNLWQQFRPGVDPPKEYGHNRDWNVDLIPKFIMANGKLVKMLLHTKVTKYLEWKCVDASFVAQNSTGGMFKKGGLKIAKIPGNETEAIKSSLLNLLQKKNLAQFYGFIGGVELDKKETWKKYDLDNMTCNEIFKKYGISESTKDFLGHAVALYTDDDYLEKNSKLAIEKMQLYTESIGRYGDSPFLYPIYGLGGLPEAFSRLCAIHGGTYMLNTKVDEVTMDEAGKVTGIKVGDDIATAPLVICDPSYVTQDKLKKTGQIIRAICLLNHPIPNTKEAPSIQIILPAKQMSRKSDTYISMVSYSHLICAKGIYVAIISAQVETEKPEEEIQEAISLLGEVLEMFVSVSDCYEPQTDGTASNLWVTKSYDATSHFEEASEEILDIYQKIIGEQLDLNIEPDENEEDY